MKRKEKVWRPWCSEITSLDDAVASIGEPGDERTDSLQYGGGEVSRRKRRWISPEKSGVCRRFKDYRPAGKTPFTRMIISWDTVRLWIYVSRITLSFCVMFQRGCSYRHFVRLWLSFCGSKVVILWIYRCHNGNLSGTNSKRVPNFLWSPHQESFDPVFPICRVFFRHVDAESMKYSKKIKEVIGW